MEEIKKLLWKREYEECIASCRRILDKNPSDAVAWYCMFLAENRNFNIREKEMNDILAYQKAHELAGSSLKEKLETDYLVLDTLKDTWFLGNLYLAIQDEIKESIIMDLESSLKDKSQMNVEFKPEFILSLLCILSTDSKNEMEYLMLMDLINEHLRDERFSKILEREKKKAGIPEDFILNYISEYKRKKASVLKPKTPEFMAEEYKEKVSALKEEMKQKSMEFDAYKSKMEIEIKTNEMLLQKAVDEMSSQVTEQSIKEILEPEKGKNPGITFGSYLGEPLHWRVLEVKDNHALVVTEKIIEVKRFDNDSNNYEKSEIRNWLNQEFYDGFSKEDKRRIIKSRINNSLASTSCIQNPCICNDTWDTFFLLSALDVKKFFKNNADRLCSGTEHALKEGLWVYDKNRCSCWLCRSPHYDAGNVQAVSSSGQLYSAAACVMMGIRPACIIRLC